MTYFFRGVHFRRGEIKEVPEGLYHDLIRRGVAADPDRQVDFVLPPTIKHAPNGAKIPVIRDMGLGDVLMVSIPLRDFCARHKKKDIVYCTDTRYVPLFKELGFCEVMAIPKLRGHYQYGVDLRGFVEKHPRARRVDRIDLFSNYLLGGPPSSYDYPLTATQRWIMRGRAIARMDTEIRPTVALTWQASMKNRSWGPEYNIRFARIAIAEGWRVVILHNRSLAPDTFGSLSNHPQLIDLSAQLTIEDLLHVTSAVDVMVAPDTGTAHLAEAVKTKSVLYYTTVPPDLRVGHYHYARVLYPEGQLACLGCIHTPTCHQPDPKPCALLTTPEMAWNHVVFVHENDPPWSLMPHREAWQQIQTGKQLAEAV